MALAAGVLAEQPVSDTVSADGAPTPQPAAEHSVGSSRRRFADVFELKETYEEFQDFRNCIFEKAVKIDGARFRSGFSFEGSEFYGAVRIKSVSNDRVASSIASFKAARFYGSFKVVGGSTTTLYMANFANALFHGVAQFKHVRFVANADFSGCGFNGPANFSKSIFHGIGSFVGTRFSGPSVFRHAEFRYAQSHARFTDARFHGVADFGKVQFSGDASFESAHFTAGANFYKAAFTRSRDIESGEDDRDNAIVTPPSFGDRRVAFDAAVFRATNEHSALFLDRARFGDAYDPRGVSFRNCKFLPPLFRATGPLQECSFIGIECHGHATFERAQFDSLDVQLSHSTFDGNVDLSGARFGGDLKFAKCTFKEELFVGETKFSNTPDFRQAVLVHTPEFGLSNIIALPKLPAKTLPKDEAVQRLKAIRRLASRADDKKVENALFIEEIKLEGGTPSWLYRLVSNYGQSWAIPALWLLLLTFLLFPAANLAVSNRLPYNAGQAAALYAQRGLSCANGTPGDAISAALEMSLRNALIVGNQDQNRASVLVSCIGGVSNDGGYRGVVSAAIQAVQVILTLTLVFFVGAAVRRRLQIR